MAKVIFAGHYCLNEELEGLGNEGTAEYLSWKEGVTKFLEDKNNSKLVLWINDIGIDVDTRNDLKENYILPDNYLKVLEEGGLTSDSVDLVFESSVRNKASKFIKKNKDKGFISVVDSKEDGLIRCVENDICELDKNINKKSYVIEGPEEKKLVVKDGPNPKCNMILATLFKKYDCNSKENIEFINIYNAIYKNRIKLGIHVYRTIYSGKSNFENIFFDFLGTKKIQSA
jgi:hypothetical protein